MRETRGEGGRKDKQERGGGWETERDEGEGQKGDVREKTTETGSRDCAILELLDSFCIFFNWKRALLS